MGAGELRLELFDVFELLQRIYMNSLQRGGISHYRKFWGALFCDMIEGFFPYDVGFEK